MVWLALDKGTPIKGEEKTYLVVSTQTRKEDDKNIHWVQAYKLLKHSLEQWSLACQLICM